MAGWILPRKDMSRSKKRRYLDIVIVELLLESQPMRMFIYLINYLYPSISGVYIHIYKIYAIISLRKILRSYAKNHLLT